MAKITKRGRGRPTRIEALQYNLQEAVIKGSETLLEAYPRAMDMLVSLMDDEKSTQATKLNAAKTIIANLDQLNEDFVNQDEEEDGTVTPEESNNTPVLRLTAN